VPWADVSSLLAERKEWLRNLVWSLECFIWADRLKRLERVRRAIETLRDDPPELIAGDYAELLPDRLEQRDEDAIAVAFETAPLAYVEDCWPLELTVRPGGETRRLGLLDFHAAWLE